MTTTAAAAAETTPLTYGVHSEVGRLRKVLVCAPGLAHRRLTPTNNDDLLFDDVMWVENAQRDHADFVNKLPHRGVEVVELHDLLAQTMDVPGARDWLLDRKIVPNRGRASAWSTAPAPTSSRSSRQQLAELPDRRAGHHTTCPRTSAPATSAWPASRPAPAST